MNNYDKSYYESNNYSNYMNRAGRYMKTAAELTALLSALSLIKKETRILDYGCAVGFLMEGLREMGFPNSVGIDVSDWAREEGRKRGNDIRSSLEELEHGPYPEIVIALDVLEHMTIPEVSQLLGLMPKALIVRIPTSMDDGKTFHLEVSRRDPTHITCMTKEQWIQVFKDHGYKTFLELNLYTIYDSPGVACLLIL